MSPGRWGAADCRGDRPVAGWRCLRPAVPSRWKLRSLSAPLFISVPPTPPCHLSLALSLSHCVTVLQRRIRSDTAWLALAVNTALRHANTHTTQLKQFVLLSINTHYHALLCGCDKCFLVYRGPASQPLMPAMETIHRGTAVGPKCSLPPIVQPLHFFINSKSKKKKKKRAISGHSEQIHKVNNCRQKVGQPGKKHSATAGSNSWFIMLPASVYNKRWRQYGGHG